MEKRYLLALVDCTTETSSVLDVTPLMTNAGLRQAIPDDMVYGVGAWLLATMGERVLEDNSTPCWHLIPVQEEQAETGMYNVEELLASVDHGNQG